MFKHHRISIQFILFRYFCKYRNRKSIMIQSKWRLIASVCKKSCEYRDQTLHKSTCLLMDTSLSSLFILSSILVFYFYGIWCFHFLVSMIHFADSDLNTSSGDICVSVIYIFSVIQNHTLYIVKIHIGFNTRKSNY